MGIGRVLRQVKEAGDTTGRVLRDDLPRFADDIGEAFGNFGRKTRGNDNIDTPGTRSAPDRPRNNRNDGRDERGRFIGDGNRPWVDREHIGLSNVGEREGVDIIRTLVASRHPDTGDQVRYFDGLFRNSDGTYTGIEVKSGSANRNAAQRVFDGAVNVDRPAVTTLPDVGPINITNVILERVR